MTPPSPDQDSMNETAETFLDSVSPGRLNGIRFDETHLPGDAIAFEFSGIHEGYVLVLATDGTGVIFCKGKNGWTPTDYFFHEADMAAMKELADGERDDAVYAFFAEEVNPRLGDPFVLDGEILKDSGHFTCGSETEIKRLGRLIVQSEPAFLASRDSVVICFEGLTDEDKQASNIESIRTWSITGIEPTPRLNALMQIAEEINEFHGTDYYYNDGPEGRRSGHTAVRASIEVTVAPISGHEALAALDELKSVLEQYGISYDDISRDIMAPETSDSR